MDKSNKKDSYFYVYPHDKKANDAIYATLRERGEPLITTSIQLKGEKNPLPVLEVSNRFASLLEEENKSSSEFRFTVYWQYGDTIRRWRLHEPEIKKRALALAAIARRKACEATKSGAKT